MAVRYDIYVDGQLRRVVSGQTAAGVDSYVEGRTVSIIAIDTADDASEAFTVFR